MLTIAWTNTNEQSFIVKRYTDALTLHTSCYITILLQYMTHVQ